MNKFQPLRQLLKQMVSDSRRWGFRKLNLEQILVTEMITDDDGKSSILHSASANRTLPSLNSSGEGINPSLSSSLALLTTGSFCMLLGQS
jgi:hypothetical protein